MRKSHFVLLVATAILALSSAYSLAAINQVYNIGFEWYSQFEGRYEGVYRDVSSDRQALPAKDIDLGLSVIDSEEKLEDVKKDAAAAGAIATGSLSKYIYIYCSLGRTDLPEYRIKVVNVAQRGNNLEVRLSINTPGDPGKASEDPNARYSPFDIVRIDKNAFPSKGRLYVIFKNQDGIQLAEQYASV